MTLRDGIKAGAAFGTGMYAQGKMLKGLNSFYKTTKIKAFEFVKNNPLLTPAEYMATPEGVLFKAMNAQGNGIKVDRFNKTSVNKQHRNVKANIKNLNKFLEKFDSEVIKVGNKVVLLDKKGMKHVMERHHPRYWNGSIKNKQSFFSNNIDVDEITASIKETVKQNREFILQNSNPQYQVQGVINGKTYILGINNGRVGQFYSLEQ